MEVSFSYNPIAGNHIATKFSTIHDNRAVVLFAKFCSNHLVRIWMRAQWNFHHVCIVMEKSLVKWAPAPTPSMIFPFQCLYHDMYYQHWFQLSAVITGSNLTQCCRKHAIDNWPNSQIPECTCSISHNVPFRTEMCTFLFWMEHCGIWNRCILGFVKLIYWRKHTWLQTLNRHSRATSSGITLWMCPAN